MLAGVPATVSSKLTMHQSIPKNASEWRHRDMASGATIRSVLYFHSCRGDSFLLKIIEVRGHVLCLFFPLLSFYLS